MKARHVEIGVCGLSCRLCPRHHTDGVSRCPGCKSEYRMGAGCPFITCAFKGRKLEFCWECKESRACQKWGRHRDAGKKGDSFMCYQTLSSDVVYIQKEGVERFVRGQVEREALLREMLREFDEGRSKSYYCIAATVMEPDELRSAMEEARKASKGLGSKEKAKAMHGALDGIAERRGYRLKMRN